MILEVDNITFKFYNHTLFENLSFKHDFKVPLAIVGAAGSGKSTLGELIVGLKKPKSGAINICASISLVLQNAENQFFYNQIYKDIMFGCKNHNISKNEAHMRLKTLLKEFDLHESIINSSPSELSQGQLKKISIISILILQPEVLVLDEPTLGLDYKSKIKILKYLKQYCHNKNLKIIFITHDPDIIEYFNTDVIKLQKGRIQFKGTNSEFKSFCINNGYQSYLTKEQEILCHFNMLSSEELYEYITSK